MNVQNKNGVFYRQRMSVLALLLGISMLLGACAPSTPSPAPTEAADLPTAAPVGAAQAFSPITSEQLVGAIWQWVGGREPLSSPPFQAPDPGKYTLAFYEDGSLFVQADCNTSRGEYKLSGDQLTITLGATTLVACEADSLSNQFMTSLGKAAQAGSGFGNLVIVLADEAGEMYFRPTAAPDLVANLAPITQEEMVDTLWQWTSLEEAPPASGVGVGAPENYDLVFRTDGTYSAKADCNRLNGTYAMNGSQLTINPGMSSLAACEPDSRYDQYMSLLWRVTGVGQREGLLVLLLDDGSAAMSFVNAGASPVIAAPPTVEGDPALALGVPNGVENFDNSNNWSTFDNSCFSTQVTGGQFVMTAKGIPQFSCWEVSWPKLDNFYIETSQVMPQTCEPQDRFGLLFRAPDTNRGYLYGFSCAGDYSLTAWDGQTTTTLVQPKRNAAILSTPGAMNRMGLMAFGGDLSLYVNGVYLETVVDYTFLDAGKIGYFVRAATENPFTVSYDQLRVWVLEDEFFPPTVVQPLPPIDIPTPPSNTPTGEARVNVNVRTGPSTLFPIVGTAQQGDTGEVLGISPDGFWYAIRVPTNRVGTGIGWSSAQFVNLTNPTGRPLTVVTPPLLPSTVNFSPPSSNAPQVVMREPATVRSGPTLEFPVMGVAPVGARSEVIGESADREWWAIRVPTTLSGEGTAWVVKAFTSSTNISGVPVVRTPSLPNNINPSAPASGAPSLITIEPLNVRTGPGNAYPSLGQVGRGAVMAVIGVSPDREHFIVNIPTSIHSSGQGWVPARFVSAQNVGNIPVIQPPPAP